MIRKFFPVTVLLFFGLHLAHGQNYQVQTLYMYSYTKYIKWPAERNEQDFRIGVLGDSPIKEPLSKMCSLKKAGERSLKMVTISNPGEIGDLDMLFIPRGALDQEDWLLVTQRAKKEHILLLTEEDNMPADGHINFITSKDKTIFQLNKSGVDNAGLRVATELLALAQLI